MTADDGNTPDLGGVAERLGVDPDWARDRAETVESVVDLARSLPGWPDDRDHPRATDVEVADDEVGAFRQQFELPAADGPLSERVAVKANLPVAGVPTDCGADVEPVVPDRSAAVVDRLWSAGADVVATTTMDELAYGATGTTGRRRVENPAAPDRVPGGSSAGSAAAVAADLVDGALGSDTAGSVRVPAAYCGVVGFKPTRGAVARREMVDLAPTLDHVGVLGRDVDTVERLFEAVRGPDPADPWGVASRPAETTAAPELGADPDPESLRVGVVEPAVERTEPGVGERLRSTAESLEAAGAEVDRVAIEDWGRAVRAVSVISGVELAALVSAGGAVPGAAGGDVGGELLRRLREKGAGPTVRAGLVAHGGAAAATDGETYARGVAARRAIAERVEAALSDRDLLLTPTTPTPAPRRSEAAPGALEPFTNTAPLNLSGHPAVSVPAGRVDGAPVGVQVVAGHGRDERALAAARLVEEVA